ncbi:hypothetical protein PENTCL1PPCAC_2510, partial [Pristionchus entomophagus]
ISHSERFAGSSLLGIGMSTYSNSTVDKVIDYDKEGDKMLEKLMKISTNEFKDPTEHEVFTFLEACYKMFMSQPMCLELTPPLTLCGDIHGQFNDLIRIFKTNGFPPKTNYLFLGDYIDRGAHSIETMLFLLAIKLKYPLHFFLLRGNHETSIVNRIYGFHQNIMQRYGTERVYNAFTEVFTVMPLSALVGKRIVCMHGGLSKDLIETTTLYQTLNDIRRPLTDPPNPSMPLDLLWSDPYASVKGFQYSIRGVSCTFGPDVVNQFCDKHGIDLIVRAHQVVQDGYDFFCDRKLVTIFSAPHYCGQFDNAAAVMHIDASLKCTFKIMRPEYAKRKKSKK